MRPAFMLDRKTIGVIVDSMLILTFSWTVEKCEFRQI